MPVHVVGAVTSSSSLSAGFVANTVRRLNASFGAPEPAEVGEGGGQSSLPEVTSGSSLRVLLAIRHANGEGAAED